MYAQAEDRIIQALRDTLPPGVHIGPVRDLEAAKELRQKAPACWVIYDGYRVGERIPKVNSVVQVEQDWFVVVQTRSARGNGAVDKARDEADGLCDAVISALLGLDLGGGKSLRLEEAPGPEYSAGYCHVPLAFSNAATFRGQQS